MAALDLNPALLKNHFKILIPLKHYQALVNIHIFKLENMSINSSIRTNNNIG